MGVRVELWELTGSHWRLPIRVVWHAELAEVRVGHGARLTSRMMAVAEEKLLTVGQRMGTNFWLSQENLGKIAKPSQFEDPEEVIEWFPPRAGRKLESNFQASEFVRGYCSDPGALVADPLIAEAIYFSFCRYMLHWLLNEQKEVDLVFAKLNSFLFRSNWKSIAAGLDPNWKDADPQHIVDRGMGDRFVTFRMTAWNAEQRTLRHTLDCRTTEEWERFSNKVEMERKRRTHQQIGQYQNSVFVRIKRQMQKVIQSYAQYLREAACPHVRVPVIKFFSSGSIKAHRRMEPIEATSPRLADVRVHEDEKQSVRLNMDTTDASVPEVPDLQSDEGDMRDAG